MSVKVYTDFVVGSSKEWVRPIVLPVKGLDTLS